MLFVTQVKLFGVSLLGVLLGVLLVILDLVCFAARRDSLSWHAPCIFSEAQSFYVSCDDAFLLFLLKVWPFAVLLSTQHTRLCFITLRVSHRWALGAA